MAAGGPGRRHHPAAGDRWRNIDRALRDGLRGLEGDSSLARLLAAERGVRNVQGLPPLTEEAVLAWSRSHQRRTGEWPDENAGPVEGAEGERWKNLDTALRLGLRGLPGGDSLAQLLARERGR